MPPGGDSCANNRMSIFLPLAVSLLPLGLTPPLAFLIGRGYLNFGGGCKDMSLTLPRSGWSIPYAVASLLGWRRGLSMGRAGAWATPWGSRAVPALLAD